MSRPVPIIPIDDEPAEYVAIAQDELNDLIRDIIERILRNDPTLILINLNNMNIGDDNAIAIANALSNNTRVVSVTLVNCNLYDRTAIAFAELLSTNRTVRELELDDNFITSSGAMQLVISIVNERSDLNLLLLRSNYIDSYGQDLINEYIRTYPRGCRIISEPQHNITHEIRELIRRHNPLVVDDLDVLTLRLPTIPRSRRRTSSEQIADAVELDRLVAGLDRPDPTLDERRQYRINQLDQLLREGWINQIEYDQERAEALDYTLNDYESHQRRDSSILAPITPANLQTPPPRQGAPSEQLQEYERRQGEGRSDHRLLRTLFSDGDYHAATQQDLIQELEEQVVEPMIPVTEIDREERNGKYIDRMTCPVCFINEKDTRLTCGHLCCGQCASMVHTCPICRTLITSRDKIYYYKYLKYKNKYLSLQSKLSI
jgi:hypothetical protein